jgi:hypothetical protein
MLQLWATTTVASRSTVWTTEHDHELVHSSVFVMFQADHHDTSILTPNAEGENHEQMN